MRLTPLDIRKQPFRKNFLGGFDPDQVNGFLEQVANEFESIIKQNNELATQIKFMSEKLEDYIKIERTINETLLTAQKVTDEARVNAQREAELLIKDAQIRADMYEDEARRRVHQLESDLTSLRNQRDSFLSRFRAMLSSQLGLVETISDSLKEPKEKARYNRRATDETMAEVTPQQTAVTDDIGN
jgi:cell division initiation protein